jgi:hypothetical protein
MRPSRRRRWPAAYEFHADPAGRNPRRRHHPGPRGGSSRTRLLATLVSNLQNADGRYALQVMAEGGGMANATVVERI